MFIMAMASVVTACTANENANENAEDQVEDQVEDSADDAADEGMDNVSGDVTAIGEGETVFTFTVMFEDATMHLYEVSTDAATVGEALLALELIEGEDGDYGLYVKTVDGVTLDWDTDAAYWAFYIDGDMAMTGVDATEIVEGSTYSFGYAQ